MISAMMYFQYHTTFKNTFILTSTQFLVPIIFASSIFILIKTDGIISKILQTNPLQFLGKISYSLYLNQALVIGFMIPKLFKWINLPNEDLKKIICVLIILTILVAYAWLTQLIIEQKLGTRLSKLTNSKS
jgi:peptidoglycan/LPS O-acetylase OafA/YrhL